MIYLDHNATTPMLPEAWDAMRRFAGHTFGNPSSSHSAGRQARRALEDAREKVAALLGASAEEVIFTSGATEANNLAILGLCGTVPGRIVASPLEHPCVLEPLKQLAKRGFEIQWLSVGSRGIVPLPSSPLSANLVVLQLANHETGAIQPVREFTSHSFPVHTDAAQAVGKIPVNFHELGVVSMSLSAHKFRGPKGVGALLLKNGAAIQPLLFGGHQQRGYRPGTESPALAVGLSVALDHAIRHREEAAVRMNRLRADFLERLRSAVPTLVVNGPPPGEPDSLPTTLNISFPGLRADLLLMSLDLAGVACSTGSACSSGSLLPSSVLVAMGVEDSVLRSALRFSFGETTDETEVVSATTLVVETLHRFRASLPQ
jgi:cysteine desulfurase